MNDHEALTAETAGKNRHEERVAIFDEPLSEERLADMKHIFENGHWRSGWSSGDVSALLAEVDRLRALVPTCGLTLPGAAKERFPGIVCTLERDHHGPHCPSHKGPFCPGAREP